MHEVSKLHAAAGRRGRGQSSNSIQSPPCDNVVTDLNEAKLVHHRCMLHRWEALDGGYLAW